MLPSLRLQRSLFRRQQSAIAATLPPPSAAFRAYEASYRRRTREMGASLSESELFRRVRAADIVFVGDYHTLPEARQSYLRLVRAVRGGPRPVWMALGSLPTSAQGTIDRYLQSRATEDALRAALGLEDDDPFGDWPRIQGLLSFARRNGHRVLALEDQGRRTRSFPEQDAQAGQLLARVLQREDAPRILVLTGQYHVATEHLPRAVQTAAPTARALVVHQNCESVYWKLLARGETPDGQVVALGAGALCWMTATPLACQQSFLDSIDAEEGDRPLEGDLPTALERMAHALGQKAGVKVDAGLRRLQVLTAAEGAPLEKLRAAPALNFREMGQLERHVLSLESGYFPKARLIYLARRSLNHAAEEVSHFVRHCQVGDAMVAPRPELEAFYARCLEEALAFCGSRLLNPDRLCRTLPEWAQCLKSGGGLERRVAARVLAHKEAEREGDVDAALLVPPATSSEFHAVSHALGYLLGDAMSRAWTRRRLKPAEFRALFTDPLNAPREQYLAWTERFDRE